MPSVLFGKTSFQSCVVCDVKGLQTVSGGASYLSSFVLCIKFFPNDAMDVFRVLGHSQVKMHLCLTVSSSEEGASHLNKGQQFKAEHKFVLFAAAVP